jgi:hypothetical protein
MQVSELSYQGCDEKRHDRLHGSDVDPPTEAGVVPQFLGCVFHLEEYSSRPVEERRARFREYGLTTETMKQLVSNLAFKVQNLLA